MKNKTKQILAFLLVIILFSSVLTACSAENGKSSKANASRTVVDMEGNEVKIPNVVDNYAVVFAGDFDIVAMLDGCKHMSAFSETILKYEHVLKAFPELNDKIALPRRNVSTESIIESGAQVVILRENDYPELSKQLRQLGIPVVDMNFENFDDLKKCVSIFAEIMNTAEITAKAEKYIKFLDDEVKFSTEFRQRNGLNDKLSVLAMRDADNLEAYSPDRMMSSWSDACGMDYCLKETPGNQNLKLTTEQLLQYDPDYIVFVFDGNAEKFLAAEKVASLSAVKNNHIYQSPTVFNPFVVNGVEVALQMKWMYSVVYPNLVDYDMVKVTKQFYEEYFDYSIDDDELNKILALDKK